jgi:hypothetical protein
MLALETENQLPATRREGCIGIFAILSSHMKVNHIRPQEAGIMSQGDPTQEIYSDWGNPADNHLGRDRLHDAFGTAESIATCGSFQYFGQTGCSVSPCGKLQQQS